MTSHPHRKPASFTALDFVLDRVLGPVRWALWPIWALTKTLTWTLNSVWLLSNEYAKRRFSHCGTGVRIYGRLTVSAPDALHVGDNVHINSNALLRAEGGLHIGDNVHISKNLVVYTMNHNYHGDCLPYDAGLLKKPVRIEDNVWIGMNVVVAPGVTIGEGAIIGMGCVVAKDVAPLSIVGSAPQRELKTRDIAHYRRLATAKQYGGMSGYPVVRKGTNKS